MHTKLSPFKYLVVIGIDWFLVTSQVEGAIKLSRETRQKLARTKLAVYEGPLRVSKDGVSATRLDSGVWAQVPDHLVPEFTVVVVNDRD